MDESMVLYNYLMCDWLAIQPQNPVKSGTHITKVVADARVYHLQQPWERGPGCESFHDFTTVKDVVNHYIVNQIVKFCKRCGDWDHIADVVLVLKDVQVQANAMVLAAMYSEKRRLQILLKGGCDVNARSVIREYRNMTPLIAACRMGSSETIKMLVAARADVKACDEARHTCLHHLVNNRELMTENKYEIIQLLKQKGADILREHECGAKPLV